MSNTSMPSQAPHAWSKSALLAKAQKYAEEMLSHARDDWRFVFWSTLTLELLARAALAHVSPVLLAEPKDWSNAYFSLGHNPKRAKFVPKSIDMLEVLKRLHEVVPGFTPELFGIAVLHIDRRNEELHSGGSPLEGLGTSRWLADFYRACQVLLESMDESLEDLLGDDEGRFAIDLVAAAKDESALAVNKNVQAHKLVWSEKAALERETLKLQAQTWATKHDGHRVLCPACDSNALIAGAAVAAPKKHIDGDNIIEAQQFLPARFECVACGLKISGLPQLIAAGLGDSYTATYKYDAAEYYAPVDDHGGYEPDYNEP